MEREAELLNAILALQGEVDVLKHDISRAKRIPEKAELAPIESSLSDKGGTVGMDEVESDLGAFENNINPEEGKTTPNTSVMGSQTNV